MRSRFSSFVLKEFRHILRDKRTLMILLLMPVLLLILFGFALSTEIKNVRVGVFDPSMDAATQRITRQIDASAHFNVVMLQSDGDIDMLFRSGTVDIVLVYGESFYQRLLANSEASVQIIADGSNTNVALMGTVYLQNIISSFQIEMAQESVLHAIGETAGAFSGEESDAVSMPAAPIVINAESRMLYNPQLKSSFNFVPGVMGMIFMIICAMMTSISIVREKQRGTMEILLVSPVNPLLIIVAKTIPYFAVSLVNYLTIIILAVTLLGMPIAGSLLSLTLVSLLYILVSLTLGIFISTVVSTQEVAIIIAGIVLMLPTMMLSGMLFPIQSMPEWLQWLSACIPPTWYIDCVKCIMISGLSISFCLKQVVVLLGFEALFASLSLLTFKVRL